VEQQTTKKYIVVFFESFPFYEKQAKKSNLDHVIGCDRPSTVQGRNKDTFVVDARGLPTGKVLLLPKQTFASKTTFLGRSAYESMQNS
jgi:hypothetical protein